MIYFYANFRPPHSLNPDFNHRLRFEFEMSELFLLRQKKRIIEKEVYNIFVARKGLISICCVVKGRFIKSRFHVDVINLR